MEIWSVTVMSLDDRFLPTFYLVRVGTNPHALSSSICEFCENHGCEAVIYLRS